MVTLLRCCQCCKTLVRCLYKKYKMFKSVRTFSEFTKCILRRNSQDSLVWSNPYSTRSVRFKYGGFQYCGSEMCHPSFASVYLSRSFAKGKNKVKSGIKIIAVNDQELGELFEVEKLKEDFSKPISHMVKMYMEQLSIRSAAGAIEGIPVKYDGNTYTVQDLAEIGRKGTKEVILEMDAFVDAIPSVITALSNSALGLNPSQQGSSIIIPIPKVTREYREKLAKGAKLCFTSTKDAIKKVQAKYIRVVDDNETLSVDFKANLKTQLTYLASKTIAEAELIYKNKEKELLSSE